MDPNRLKFCVAEKIVRRRKGRLHYFEVAALVLLCVPLSTIATLWLGLVLWIPTPGMLVFFRFANHADLETPVGDVSNYPALALAGIANVICAYCVYAIARMLVSIVIHLRKRRHLSGNSGT